jgi:hypothetical protein
MKHKPARGGGVAPRVGRTKDRGSALIMVVFVLVLLTGMGTALLFLSQHEARMSQASLRGKKAFYLAEAAIEDGRRTLYVLNGDGPFGDDLVAFSTDGNIDFDPDAIEAVYDSAGNVTGITGYGDDTPLRGLTQLGDAENPGWYAAFLTNDPVDGYDTTADTNERVMITGIGAGPDRSFEMVQAIIEPFQFLPPVPPAAMTLLGPNPYFDNGDSNAQAHTGNDCGVGGGAFAPIVGGIGNGNSQAIKDRMNRPEKFESGPLPHTGEDTIGDLIDPSDPIVADAGNGTIDLQWTDCQVLKDLVEFLAIAADYYCNSDTQSCTIAPTGPDDVIFIDGDVAGTPAGSYSGILVVTGELIYNGNTGWDGVILAIGEGRIVRSGGGGGNPSGSVVVANIDPSPSGPANDRSDWCTTSPDGFGQAYYDASGGGNSTIEWCTNWIDIANSLRSYKVLEFVQW